MRSLMPLCDAALVVILFDVVVLFIVWRMVVYLRRKPEPLHNWRPSDDDARSARHITLFTKPKKGIK